MDTQVTRSHYRDIQNRLAAARAARAAAFRTGASAAVKRATGKALKAVEAELLAARQVGVVDR